MSVEVEFLGINYLNVLWASIEILIHSLVIFTLPRFFVCVFYLIFVEVQQILCSQKPQALGNCINLFGSWEFHKVILGLLCHFVQTKNREKEPKWYHIQNFFLTKIYYSHSSFKYIYRVA